MLWILNGRNKREKNGLSNRRGRKDGSLKQLKTSPYGLRKDKTAKIKEQYRKSLYTIRMKEKKRK